MLRKVFIIAEAGVNHNGDIRLAEKLVRAAKAAGADAVKFQTFSADKLAAASARTVGYQRSSVGDMTQKAMLKRLELGEKAHVRLFRLCQKEKVMFLSTPFDEESVHLLSGLGVRIFKIPSGELTNTPFLKQVARQGRPIILSTGMASLDEVAAAVRAVRSAGNTSLTLLHCVTEYPAPFDQVNLRAIQTLARRFNVSVGFSDHTPGIWMPLAAVALGAVVIEKHLTLDRSLPGPDHKASLVPAEFTEMVRAVRAVESAMGDGIKRPAQCEKKYASSVRKSVVAVRPVSKGVRITADDLGTKRPGSGIPPSCMKDLIGRRAKRQIREDQILTWSMVA
jgi:N-acetylneuraminate synthase/N,N'-diacetyllegionaminate synthase